MATDTVDSSDILVAALAKVEMIINSDRLDFENCPEIKRYVPTYNPNDIL